MYFLIFFLALFTNSFAFENKNDVCTILSICDNISAIQLEVAAVREEQKRQANILEGASLSDISSDPANKNNNELCTILSICNNLAEISAELAAIRVEQARQADLVEKSCKKDTSSYPANCYEALKESQESGVTEILVPDYSENPFKVACDQESHRGGWTIILRRTDGSVNFYRNWRDYKLGFGQVNNEYFIGLDKLHAMSSLVRQELLVLMENFEGEKRYAMYDTFRIGSEANNYTMESLGFYSGNSYDSLTYHLYMQFSTKDRKNDLERTYSCAQEFTGAWWYRNCISSNLAGVYNSTKFGGGVHWRPFTGFNTSLKRAVMMIRPWDTSRQG